MRCKIGRAVMVFVGSFCYCYFRYNNPTFANNVFCICIFYPGRGIARLLLTNLCCYDFRIGIGSALSQINKISKLIITLINSNFIFFILFTFSYFKFSYTRTVTKKLYFKTQRFFKILLAYAFSDKYFYLLFLF